MFCRFKSRLLKQLHPALLRGGQCGLSSFLCSRRSSHSIAAARSGPCASCGRMAPSAPSMENAAVPATAANIAATRRRYQPVTAVPSGAAAHALQKQARAAAEAATPIHQPAARQSARIMPPLPSAPIQARSTKTHFGTPVCGPSRRRLSLFLLFFIPHGYNAEHAKTSSLHFSKAKARVRTETPAHSCPRPCRPWMQAAPTARRGCLAASPR